MKNKNEIEFPHWHAQVCEICNPYGGPKSDHNTIENGLIAAYRKGLSPATVAARFARVEIKAEAAPAQAGGHTPGPWEIAGTNNHCILGSSPTGLCIIACLPRDGTQLPNTAANAALMASAPDLLAALKSIEQETWFNDGDSDEVRLAALATIANLAHTALAKGCK